MGYAPWIDYLRVQKVWQLLKLLKDAMRSAERVIRAVNIVTGGKKN